ncbi:Type I secretion system membrane fusion protein PrsE [Methyloligella halotolerans]|uniref:Membrane fusion protein (MFP) family protein n=1 Tax=Methyloligella halotolerans TaxID=1177755 RepID=A0A1E2RUY8_9HYPH|nr:HlyD family type I secretion periplasmic adaptor subunit [Methyloligella halotolerans]ODA65930.1 Type I secretion system membrane fusion protein PrsE [Methyloligella halotolerans]
MSKHDQFDFGDGSFRLRGRIIAGAGFAALLLVGAGGWAATAPLTGAVVATGTVKVDRDLKKVQHRDGGIIGEISVREGDTVQKGQILVRLNDVQTRAELAIIKGQLAELSIKRARLVAEREGQDSFELPDRVTRLTPHLNGFLDGERKLLSGNVKNRVTQKEQLELTIEQLGEEINGLLSQQEAKVKEIRLAEKEHEKVMHLAAKGLIEGPRVYTAERELARLLGEQGSLVAGIARAKARISEIKLRIFAIDDEARTQAQNELSQLEPKLSELNERQIAIEDRLSRTDLRAPISGTVNEVSVQTIGGVITPAETLVTIVPRDAPLKIEAQIPPASIDQIRLGQRTKLRFSAFNQRTTPEIYGTVKYVSPSTTFDEATKQPFYVTNIEVSEAEHKRLGDITLKPGMPVDVFIATSERTAFSYFMKPLTDQFSKAFTER